MIVSIRARRLVLLCLGLIGLALAAATPLLLPSVAQRTPAPHWAPTGVPVRGAYHVHSLTSDGTGSLDEIAAAAARAGLQFVILTDHGNGMRTPEPPAYRSGVLVIDAVEISTSGGHYVALGMTPSPYPLAGDPAAVVEDVRRLGGIGIAAHPGSPRLALQWRNWVVPIDGLEWLNADSEWRDELWDSLGRLLLTYSFRPKETLASMLDRPDAVMKRWDTLGLRLRTVGLAGADAHARLGYRKTTEPYREGLHLPVPSYEASFRAFSNHVVLERPLSGDAARDAAAILFEIKAGRVYAVIDGLASPGGFEFTGTSGPSHGVPIGGYLDIAGETTLHARIAAPPGTRMILLRDGLDIFDSTQPEMHVNIGREPGVYRVEARLPGTVGHPPVPWIVSNPLYVGLRERHVAAAAGTIVPAATSRTAIQTESWVAEASPGSSSALHPAALADGTPAIAWDFALADGDAQGQFAALRFPADRGLAGSDRIEMRVQADAPMRLWVQLRAGAKGAGRWGQSIYVDQTTRTIDARYSNLVALDDSARAAPALGDIDALLLVVDTLNTRPGTRGTVRFPDLWLAR